MGQGWFGSSDRWSCLIHPDPDATWTGGQMGGGGSQSHHSPHPEPNSPCIFMPSPGGNLVENINARKPFLPAQLPTLPTPPATPPPPQPQSLSGYTLVLVTMKIGITKIEPNTKEIQSQSEEGKSKLAGEGTGAGGLGGGGLR